MPRILLKWAKQELLLIMLCGVGLQFNLVRDELIEGVSDKRSVVWGMRIAVCERAA